MKDFTFCANEKCLRKEACERYVSAKEQEEIDPWQSYFRPNEKDCEYYMPISKRPKGIGISKGRKMIVNLE
jgi:hypothetical protein